VLDCCFQALKINYAIAVHKTCTLALYFENSAILVLVSC